jgi:uncharacterized protein (UPF0332 family)
VKIEDCYRNRLLRKTGPDLGKSSRSLEMAFERLNKAIELRNSDSHEECLVAAYSAMLMAARALLFRDGIIEKNHYCVVLYLRKNYFKDIGEGPISWLDIYRSERHQWFYGIDGLTTSDIGSQTAIGNASRFIDIIEGILE